MRPAWHEQALCAQVGGDLWFPDKGESAVPAKRICRRCPVQLPCLRDGVGERHGIYGGLTPNERLRLRSEEKETAA